MHSKQNYINILQKSTLKIQLNVYKYLKKSQNCLKTSSCLLTTRPYRPKKLKQT